MAVHTSKVYSDGSDDLSLSPDASKKLKITSGLDTGNPNETPLTTNTTDGVVKRMDVSALDELTGFTEDTDLILYQDTSDAKKIKAISANAFGGATQPQLPDPLPSEGVWVDKDSTLAVKAGGSGSTAALQNSVEFAVVDNTFNQSDKNVVTGNRVQARWQDSKLLSATHGQTISGTLYAKTGSSYTQTWELAILKQPTAGWNLTDLIDQPVSTVIPSNISFPTGFNAPAPVTIDGGTLTNIEVSINGAAFTSSPGTILPDQPIIVRGTTGAANTTDYTAIVSIGGIQRTWTVTTEGASISIAQPSITAPVDGATGLGSDITVTATAYSPNGAGTHTSSDWELYAGGSLVSSSPGDTVNLESWTIPPGDLTAFTAYTVKVRYNSADPVSSPYSNESNFETGTFVLNIGDAVGGGFFMGQIMNFASEIHEAGAVDAVYNYVLAPAAGGLKEGLISQQQSSLGTGFSMQKCNGFYNAQNSGYNSSYNQALNRAPGWVYHDPSGPNAGSFRASHDGGGTGLGGYNDWFLPTQTEQKIAYRYFKPTADNNDTGSYSHLTGGPGGADYDLQRTAPKPYTKNDPPLTSLDDFKVGQPEAYVTSPVPMYHVSISDQFQDNMTVRGIYFTTGLTNYAVSSSTAQNVRVMRRFEA